MRIERKGEYVYEIPAEGAMRVPGRVYGHPGLFEQAGHEEALQQVMNVAQLPGIVKASIAMPDIHWGYGFPIGGVAAMDEAGGVVSPGGVGFDINCGVRLVRTGLGDEEVRPRLEPLLHELMRCVPQGAGPRGALELKAGELERLAEEGAAFLARRGLATEDDLAHTEERGALPGADTSAVSRRALERGRSQVGSLGSGNHFLEVQVVDEVFDEAAASAYGVAAGQVVVMIHSGSRGFGHQICTDHVARMASVAARHGIELPDRQLACAPLGSPEAREYLAAMACACNFAFANRQMMQQEVRAAFERVFNSSWERLGLELVYDVAHNIAKREVHVVGGRERAVWVHRKGATRFVVSGGGVEFMRPWTEKAYGIPPEQIVGSSGVVKFIMGKDGHPQLLKTEKVEFVDDGPGKPVGINRFIGRKPIFAFGNSDGDLQMLQWITAGGGPHFAGLVHHTDAEREYAYDRRSHIGKLDKALDEATAKNWAVVDMKKDWKRIFPQER